MHSTSAAGALLTGLTTLTAVAGCVAVAPDPGTRPYTGTYTGPGTGQSVPAAPGPVATPLPGREVLATIGPAPRPQRITPPPPTGTARPEAPAPEGPPPAAPPEAPAPRPAPARPARTAEPPPAVASGGAVDVCALGEEYGRWAPGGREAAVCAEHFGP